VSSTRESLSVRLSPEWLLSLELLSVVLVVALVVAWLWWTASRLDRMHHRIDLSRASLDTALARRSAVVLELGASGWLDPARGLLLLDSAHAAREAPPEVQLRAESELSQTLRAVFADHDEVRRGRQHPGIAELLDALARDAHQVRTARRIHDDLVTSSQRLRRTRRVRLLRLAGRAPLPTVVELDDEPPRTLPLPPAPTLW
jgi:hypothetical protein